MSQLYITFFNANLSFQWRPFTGKNQNGVDQYDKNPKGGRAITTAGINPDYASTMVKMINEIGEGKHAEGCQYVMECNGGIKITFERKAEANGTMVHWLNVARDNGPAVQFRFNTTTFMSKQNGQLVQVTTEARLHQFRDILQAYLSGINSDLHLNKWTEDTAKAAAENRARFAQGGGGFQPKGGGNNFNRNNYNNKPQDSTPAPWAGGETNQAIGMSDFNVSQ
jgi:hypothetical protein